MKNKFTLFLLTALLASATAVAQESPADIIRSPQVADMIRYDNTPVALNSGRLDLNIPLLTLDDPDFKFPVTASYNSVGFMPTKPESSIGLNWSLAMGGVIYREVRGMADDLSGDGNLYGFLHLLKDKKSYNQETVAANPFQYLYFLTGAKFKDNNIEATPDLYRFNFEGHSGYFSIGYDGTVQVVSEKGGSLKVDLSGYEYFTTYGKSTIIKITSDNGYQYWFGGSKDNMEYSMHYTNSMGNTSRTIYPSAFFLYKVVAPNGRSMDISYKKIPASYHNDPMQIMNEQAYTKDLKDYTTNFSFTGTLGLNKYTGQVTIIDKMATVTNGQTAAYNYTLTKIALIDEVICGSQKMKFYYSPRTAGKERFKNVASTLASRCGAMLDSINLQYQDKPVKRVKFQYAYQGGTYPAFFMTQLVMPDSGAYKFGYTKTTTLPNPVKANTDYWNFLRSESEVTNQIPGITIYNNNDFVYTTNDREPNAALCDFTLLTTLTYPTGGYANISYEPHSYAKKVGRTAATAFKPALLNLTTDAIAGGARVKAIDYYDNQGSPKHVAYEYTNSKKDLRSSGILYYYPEYFRMEGYLKIYQGSQVILQPLSTPAVTYANVGLNIPSYEQDHVRYSTVREVNVEETTGGNHTISFSVAYTSSVLTNLATLNIKKDVGYWEISGMKTGGNGTIYLKQNGVTKKTLTIAEANTLRYVPDVPDGEYEIYGIKTGVYGFLIHIYAPEEHTGFYKATNFTDYSTHPDNFLDDKAYCEASNHAPTDYEANHSRLAQDRSRERGLLLSETSYDKTGKIVDCIDYSYVSPGAHPTRYTYCVNTYNGFMQQMNKTYYYPIQLQQKIQRRYSNTSTSSMASQTENYTYNADGYPNQVSTSNSALQTVTHKYTYPADYSSESACSAMLTKNMRSPRIQEEIYVNGVQTEKVRNNYVLSGSLPVLGSVQKTRGITPLSALVSLGYGGNTIGRPSSAIYRDGRKEVYLRSYFYSHIVAKIEGLTYDEVKNVLGENLMTNIAFNPAPTEAIVEQIRTKLSENPDVNKRALITTYLYKPLVGMVQQISPNGEKTSYVYDGNNRLHAVRDHDGKDVEQYDYNYKH